MKIYLINGTERAAVDAILDGEISESLTGEQLISLQLFGDDADRIADGTVIEYDGQYYDVSAYQKSGNSTAILCTVNSEHVSYRLNLAKYDVESFAFGGTYAQLLERILVDTDFTPGSTPDGSIVGFVVEGASRRELLMTAAETIGCEVAYDGYTISFVKHRGSTDRVRLSETDQVTAVSVDYDIIRGTASYNVTLGRRGTLNCGDEVHLVYTHLGLDIDTRIIAIRYNPYNEFVCSIDVGDYVADIVDSYTDMTRRVLLKADAKIEFEKYINSAEGTAAISAAMSGTYVTADALGDYVQVADLGAEVDAYLNGAEGTAAIVSALNGKFMEKPIEPVYSTPSGVTYGFEKTSDGYYTSTNAGVATSFSYGKFTFNSPEAQTVTLRCISYGEPNFDYGIISTLNSNLLQNSAADPSNVLYSFYGKSSPDPVDITLDIPAGESFITFKYRKDGGQDSYSDYFKIMVVGGYATTAEVDAIIKQEISQFESSITLTATANGNTGTFTLKSGESTLSVANITFSGYVTFNALSTAGATTINGANITTGTISAERVDTSSLRARELWYYESDTGYYYSIMSCELSGYNTITKVGAKDINNNYQQYLELYGTSIVFYSPSKIENKTSYALMFDMPNREVLPSSDGHWYLGTEEYYWDRVYAERYYLGYGGYISEKSNGNLVFHDMNGEEWTIIDIS